MMAPRRPQWRARRSRRRPRPAAPRRPPSPRPRRKMSQCRRSRRLAASRALRRGARVLQRSGSLPSSFIHCSQIATSIVVCLHRAEVIISDETRVVRFNRFIKCRGTFCSLPCDILPALMLLEPKQIPLNPCLPSLSLTILHSIPFTSPFARSACGRKANSSYILSLFPPSRLVWTIS